MNKGTLKIAKDGEDIKVADFDENKKYAQKIEYNCKRAPEQPVVIFLGYGAITNQKLIPESRKPTFFVSRGLSKGGI
jgi:hypothetical protein